MGIFNSATGFYDEQSCLYSMQTNQSDLGIVVLWYPPEGENLEPHPIYMVDISNMVSRYIILTQTQLANKLQSSGKLFTQEQKKANERRDLR